jgi:hypothetical protein
MMSGQAADAVSGVTPEAAVVDSGAVRGIVDGTGVPASGHPRRRAVWSDLRKGVIAAIGLAFVFTGRARLGKLVGLVLMFLGVGYIVLWWFEDRHFKRHETGADVGVDVGKS